MLSLLALFAACQDSEQYIEPTAPTTYRLQFNVGIKGYDGASTRADAYSFTDKDKVHVLFQQGSTSITGTAVYDGTKDEWTITPSQTLTETDESRCSLAFFIDEASTSASTVTLSQKTRFYVDAEAMWILSDGLLTIQGQLSPALGRIRFHGTVGQRCTVSGLAFTNSFDLKKHSFELSPSKFSATCGTDGYTPYYYCNFSDAEQHQLTFELTAESGLRRSFGEGVLQAGTSGFVTIPTADSHEGWTLVNLGSGGEITFPTISKPEVSSIWPTRALLTATITSAGGGRLSEAGFVAAVHASPTIADQKVDCGTETSLSTRLSGLTPETTYYVRAYAINEAGITYSEEIVFKTPSKEEDPNEIDRDEWDEDEDWN